MLYVSFIILCLEEQYGEQTVDGESVEIDTRVVDGDKILHNICTIFDIRNWVLPNGIPVNSGSVAIFLRAQLQNIEILFSRFVFKDQFWYKSWYYEKGIHEYHNKLS